MLFRSLAASEAMVNIRATLARAENEGVLSSASRGALEAFGKSLFFPQRSWEALLDGAAARGVAASEQAALSDWLPRGRVDQKRLDALEMLAAMREASAGPEPARPSFKFEWTHFWGDFVNQADAGHATLGAWPEQRVLEELRLEGPEAYERVEALALLRAVAANGAARAPAPSREGLQKTLTNLRARLDLFARADLDRWMARNDLDAASLERLIADEKALEDLGDRSRGALDPLIVDVLRLSGDYERLAERARKKGEALAASEAANAQAPKGARVIALRMWFFEQRLGRSLPDDVEAFARRLGFADAAAFDLAVHRERALF